MRHFFVIFLCMISVVMQNICFAQTIEKKLLKEEGDFKWYRLKQGGIMGAEDDFGNSLIPLSSLPRKISG